MWLNVTAPTYVAIYIIVLFKTVRISFQSLRVEACDRMCKRRIRSYTCICTFSFMTEKLWLVPCNINSYYPVKPYIKELCSVIRTSDITNHSTDICVSVLGWYVSRYHLRKWRNMLLILSACFPTAVRPGSAIGACLQIFTGYAVTIVSDFWICSAEDLYPLSHHQSSFLFYIKFC